MADEENVVEEELPRQWRRSRTPEQEQAAGFLEPYRIAERRRRQERGEPLIEVDDDGRAA